VPSDLGQNQEEAPKMPAGRLKSFPRVFPAEKDGTYRDEAAGKSQKSGY